MDRQARDALVETWKQEEARPFSGWDFSYLEGRLLEEQPPWSYRQRAAELMAAASSLLDMGTGGGERLLALRPHWPAKVAVTEDYAPNFRLAMERLAPLGVRVEEPSLNDGIPLPFAGGEFDLILNRHSAIGARELVRILARGGTFLTQQIDGRWGQDLLAVFGAEPQWPEASLNSCVARLEAAGLSILNARDWSGVFSFTDVGAVVYYLKAIPWLVPGFSVTTHLEPLLELQNRLEGGSDLAFHAAKYLVEACRPAEGRPESAIATGGEST
jgi:SAM-dependent methyltransferase